MRNIILFTFFALTTFYTERNIAQDFTAIRYNQLGYSPKSVKKVVVVNSKCTSFELKDAKGKLAYSGKLSESKFWDKSGENVKIADFSDFSKTGSFVLSVGDVNELYKIVIKANLYKDALIGVLKNYYYQRSGMEIETKYAGTWARKMGHPDTICYFDPSAERGVGHMRSDKGWYDAGDCNKYVVNAGVTVGTILNLFELYPNIIKDGACNIPESGNGISDLLDEVKYELDWVLTMQTPDGASNMKITSKYFTGFIMPVDDTTTRYVVGKATAPTLNFCAMTAQAARIYKKINHEFANKCLEASKKAWQWAIENPKVEFRNPKGIFTGYYGDRNFTEEFWWAASELYATTKDSVYFKYLTTHEPYLEMFVGGSWSNFIGNLGSFALLLNNSDEVKELKQKIKLKLLSKTDELLIKLNENPYNIFLDNFIWGSNSDIENSAMLFAYAYHLTGDRKYLNAAVESMDYIFGKNATGYSFVTGFGVKTPMNIHHRPSGADGIKEPIPGFVVGGPNKDIQDARSGVKYESKFPAKCYADVLESYASNEVCLNWNAPAVFVLGFLEANADKLK